MGSKRGKRDPIGYATIHDDVHEAHFGKGREPDRGLIVKTGIFPNSEIEVGALMFEAADAKRQRADNCRRIAVQAVAAVKAWLQEQKATKAQSADVDEKAATAAELRATFALMIDGSRFRAMWDLGDAPEPRIMATVAAMAVKELADSGLRGHHDVTQESIEASAANLLAEVEAKHGVTHVVEDARQGRLL